MSESLAVHLMHKPKLKAWYHIEQTDRSFKEARPYPVSGMMSIWDYRGEEIYSLPDHPFLQRLSKGIGTSLFSYKGVNTTTHYFKAPSRELLFVAFRVQGAKIKEYMKFS